MGFKLAAVSTGLLLIVTAGLWFFVQMQAKEISTLKANAILLKLESFNRTEINEQVLLTVLKVQSLVRETGTNGDNN